MIPPAIQNLTQLEYLEVSGSNRIKKLPNELFNLPNLKHLGLYANRIRVIPPAIQNLSQLETLDLHSNDIKSLPNEFFNLRNLKILNLNNNPELETKIINFGNSTIKHCYFDKIKIISCYEPNTCKIIHLSDKILSNNEVKNEFDLCFRSEKINQNDKNLKSLYVMGGIILGCIVIILISIHVSFTLIKRNISKRRMKLNLDNVQYISDSDDDDIRNGMNNNNNSNSSNDNHNNSHNNNTRNNLNQNISIDLKLNTLNNTQITMSNSLPPSYYESNMNMNESLPEYSEIRLSS